MIRPLVVAFPGPAQANPAELGGKAASLLRMSEAGVSVPPGSVLTMAFFAPWFDTIKSSATWTQLTESTPQAWGQLCNTLKDSVSSLALSESQQSALNSLLRDLDLSDRAARLAVRSSSPEEDLRSASFAGIYETRLGVPPDALEHAVRACFASSLDVRVLAYKQALGFDLWTPTIAVIVQRQIVSETSGVGFSLNPVTNDYDEAVIEANWGLGSSVVEGRVSPDQFVVDKLTGQVKEMRLGSKASSVWLDPAGGTVEQPARRPTQRTLTDSELRQVTAVMGRIEKLYDTPIDIEWAYADGKLHILQARPITHFVPLPVEMLTRPGERRQLYGDAALSKGLTTNEPLSTMGLEGLESMFVTLLESWVGPLRKHLSPTDATFFFAGCRMYVNYSSLMWLASPARLATSAAPTDALMARILANVDRQQYRSDKRPSWLGFGLFWRIPRALWQLRGFFLNALFALLAPRRAHRSYQRKVDAFEAQLKEQLDDDQSLHELRHSYETRMARQMFSVLMPAVVAGMVSPSLVVRPKTDEMARLVTSLERGVTGNVVVEMGITLYRLAGRLDPAEFKDLDRLAERIEQRRLSKEFLQEWDRFLAKFGWRGPKEMDLASPRYADAPQLALRQMALMVIDDNGLDPAAAQRRNIEQRNHAYAELLRRLGPLRRVLLRRVQLLNTLFAGARDTPKHINVLFNYAVRKRALSQGRQLTGKGRLDAAEQVFDLRFADLDAAQQDAGLDLRALREERIAFKRTLDAHLTSFPAMIDSRGRILGPPATANTPDLLIGMSVSPGVVTGPVRILHSAHAKAIDKGDILVAYTTDPGWTPLFINAAAVVLEVGGVLQHGAVVAREYGKPCVVGIHRVVASLQDGERVEVNGTAGTVRRLRFLKADNRDNVLSTDERRFDSDG